MDNYTEVRRLQSTFHLYSFPTPILFPGQDDKATMVSVGELMGIGNRESGIALCCSIGMAPRSEMGKHLEAAQHALDKIRERFTPDYASLTDEKLERIIDAYDLDINGTDATLRQDQYPELWAAFRETSRRTHAARIARKEATR